MPSKHALPLVCNILHWNNSAELILFNVTFGKYAYTFQYNDQLRTNLIFRYCYDMTWNIFNFTFLKVALVLSSSKYIFLNVFIFTWKSFYYPLLICLFISIFVVVAIPIVNDPLHINNYKARFPVRTPSTGFLCTWSWIQRSPKFGWYKMFCWIKFWHWLYVKWGLTGFDVYPNSVNIMHQ